MELCECRVVCMHVEICTFVQESADVFSGSLEICACVEESVNVLRSVSLCINL